MEAVVFGIMATVFGLEVLIQAIQSVSRFACPVEGQRFMFQKDLQDHVLAAHGAELADFAWDGVLLTAPPVLGKRESHTVTVILPGLPERSVAGIYISPDFGNVSPRAMTTDFTDDEATFDVTLPAEVGTYLVWVNAYYAGSLVKRQFYRYRVTVV